MEEQEREEYNRKLLKKAAHGPRNLRILGFFSIIITLAFLGILVKAKGGALAFFLMCFPVLGTGVCTVAFFILAVSVARGETLGLTVTMFGFLAHFLVFLFCSILTYFIIGPAAGTGPGVLAILVFSGIIYSLYFNRSDMKENKAAGLGESLYAGKKSGKVLALVGSILFVGGLVAGDFGLLIAVPLARTQERNMEVAQVKRLINIFQNEEAEFLKNFKAFLGQQNPGNKTKMQASLQVLKEQVTKLDYENRERKKFHEITDLYLQAILKWEESVKLISAIPKEDKLNWRVVFEQGEKLRVEVGNMIGESYGPNKKQ